MLHTIIPPPTEEQIRLSEAAVAAYLAQPPRVIDKTLPPWSLSLALDILSKLNGTEAEVRVYLRSKEACSALQNIALEITYNHPSFYEVRDLYCALDQETVDVPAIKDRISKLWTP